MTKNICPICLSITGHDAACPVASLATLSIWSNSDHRTANR